MTTVAAVYARKSTAQSGEGEDRSVERQIANAREFAVAKGWVVADEHVYADDGVSGAETARLRARARMLGAASKKAFDVVIMQAQDRFSRGEDGHHELKQLAKRVAVWFYSDGQRFESGSFASNTLGFLKAEFAAEFRRAIASKTREAMMRKAKSGFVCGGQTFGYTNVKVNAHTERRIDAAEAAVVRRIYELYAAGTGLPSIAHVLNAEGTACPRAQQGRASGWSPGTIRAILRRPLYRGLQVYGRCAKRNADWQVRAQRRPESEWLQVPVPSARIVSEQLSRAVDERFTSQQQRSLRLRDGRLLGRPAGEGSPYLLVGLLRCATCGGGMEVLSSASGGRRAFHYGCTTARRKGPACCTNKLTAPMDVADGAVLRAVGDTLLDVRVVEAALKYAEDAILQDRSAGQRETLETALTDVDAAARRLTAAIARGGELAPLVAALETHEQRRRELEVRLEALRAPQPATEDAAVVRRTLRSYVTDWQGLLAGHVHQAQQVLRRLVKGRLVFTPHAAAAKRSGYYTFAGTGTVQPLLAGFVRNLASPTGTGLSYLELPIAGDLRRAA